MTLDELRCAAAELARRTRRAQALPERVTDPAALARVAAVLGPEHDEGRARQLAPATALDTTAPAAKRGGRSAG